MELNLAINQFKVCDFEIEDEKMSPRAKRVPVEGKKGGTGGNEVAA